MSAIFDRHFSQQTIWLAIAGKAQGVTDNIRMDCFPFSVSYFQGPGTVHAGSLSCLTGTLDGTGFARALPAVTSQNACCLPNPGDS